MRRIRGTDNRSIRALTLTAPSAMSLPMGRRCETAARQRRRIHAHPVVRVRVDDVLVADAVAVCVDPTDRLLKEAGLWISLRHRSLEDVQLVLAHRDVGE